MLYSAEFCIFGLFSGKSTKKTIPDNRLIIGDLAFEVVIIDTI